MEIIYLKLFSKGGFCLINKVEICGVNTANLPILTNKEKDDLFIKIKQGDEEARNVFINGNLRLVLSVIRRFFSKGENPDDLFQIGCVGLIKAIDNFNLDQGVQFSTYAVPMIIGEVKRYLRDNNSIRVSRSIRELYYKIVIEKEKFNKEWKETKEKIGLLNEIMKDVQKNIQGDIWYSVRNEKLDVLGSFHTLNEAIFFAEKKKKEYMRSYDKSKVWVEIEGEKEGIYVAKGYEREETEEFE